MARKLYPIGIQTFEDIRNRDNLYIDKTEYVYRMTHSDGKYFFLSRPRRFGKSLLVSTLKSYFEGKKELFEGLAIEHLEKEWESYPFSLLNCFADGKLKAYWFGSGTPTYLINMMRKFKMLPSDLKAMQAKSSSFDAPTETMTSITPLLYQSGYITIKDYDEDIDLYTLDVPNKEIKNELCKLAFIR